MRWVIALGVLAGCLQPQLTPCGEDWCLEGTTCVADELCASADQILACDGVPEGGTCTVGSGIGICDRGVCVGTGCGNDIVDLGEVCDDGNTESGDGCRADCKKIEICGDGVADDGEGCDDGNTNPADGCDACVSTIWSATAVIGGTANATTTRLARPDGVAVDRYGNLYIADTDNHCIRRVDTAGILTTAAGSGTDGFDGDGGLAPSALLKSPSSVAIDGLGNLYIADTGNNRIRRVDTSGIITTVAGSGCITCPPQDGDGDGGPATSARLRRPSGIAVDGLGTLYVADTDNHRIRRINTTGIIFPFAGTGTAGGTGDDGFAIEATLNNPHGVALDSLGNVVVADTFNHRIRRIDATTGFIRSVAGKVTNGFSGDGGPATSAQLFSPHGIAFDGDGALYIADNGNRRIRRVDATGLITTVAGNGVLGSGGDGGPALGAQLSQAHGVAVDGVGKLYIADADNHRIRRVDSLGLISTFAGTGAIGSGDGGAATTVQLNPLGVAVDSGGTLFIADTNQHRVRRVDSTGVITTVAGNGTRGDGGDGGDATGAQLNLPAAVVVDSLGNIYIADTFNHRIRRVDSLGMITTIAGTGTPGGEGDGGAATSAQLNFPSGLAVGLGNLYIADTANHRIRRIDTTGVITTVAGDGTAGFGGDGETATNARLDTPSGVAVDAAGRVYIADTNNHRVRRVDTGGIITTVVGTGVAGFNVIDDGRAAISAQLDLPRGVGVDGDNLYIADTANHRIRHVTAAGIISTVAGNGLAGREGDGGTATTARLSSPTGAAIDGAGNLYIAHSLGRVRRVDAAGLITTAAGFIDPEGMGPFAMARFADPRALFLTPSFTLVAGGTSGTIQAARTATAQVEVVAGRYDQSVPIGMLARFRNQAFGTVSGVAYDDASGLVYLTESSNNRLHVVTVVDPANENTWTIAPLANVSGSFGFADGAAATAKFRQPTGLYFDAAARVLYVADTGNHVIRAIDLSSGIVSTVAGIPATLGFFGDGGGAMSALLYAPQAITRCANGDLFIADTGNHRVRRIVAGTDVIMTVLGVGVAASSGEEGGPATTFPVHAPLGLACDAIGNLFVTSTTAVRMVPADANGIVDGTGGVQTIYGAPPREMFPASVATCLTGVAVVDAVSVRVVDSCTGLLVDLRREPE